jgi:hypothetical protein
MTNIAVGVLVVFDDPMRRVLRVSVTDLESNVPYEQDITIEKTVERRSVPKDRDVVGQRTNTTGQIVYIVAATEDEFANKQNAAISKVLRNHGLRLIPGDILEECSQKIEETYSNKAAKDPQGERKKVIDSFAAIGVTPKQLAAYLEHTLDQVVPAELASLRRIYQSIRDGETTWIAVMEEKFGDVGSPDQASRPRPQRKADAAAPAAPATPTTEAKPETAASPSDDAHHGSASAPSDAAPADPSSSSEPENPAEPAAPAPSNVRELPSGSRIVRHADPAPAPNGTKLDPKKLTPIYSAQAAYNRAVGYGEAQALLVGMFGAETKISSLTNEQADQYLAALQDGAR